jgi:hypothetical protein
MKRLLTVALACTLLAFGPIAQAKEETGPQKTKKALQALNDFIGGWKGAGSIPKDARATWKETVNWSWRFKGDDAWLTMMVTKGKYVKSAEMRYLVKKKLYQLTLVDKDGKKTVYEGTLKKRKLTLQTTDKETKETKQVVMNIAGGGIRFIYTVSHKPPNRLLFAKDFQVGCTRIGESFGAKEKKIECIVTGGLGKIPVMYKGVTYYVCCSGCKDAFNEDPEKYIKEYEAKKSKKED